jgi:hypothetical protein
MTSESNDETTLNKSESNPVKPKCEPDSQEQRRYRARNSGSPIPRVRLTENADSTTSTKAFPDVTTKERADLKNWVARARASADVKLKPSNEEPPKIVPDHPDQEIGWALLMNALGTADRDFLNGLIGQLARVNDDGLELNFHGLNFMLSVIKGLEPRNQLEAMIGAHLAVIQVAFMKTARCLTFTENVLQHDSVALNKLSRTFVMLVDALYRSRTDAPQTVQNVSVAFGQAIVANVPMSATISERDDGPPPTGGPSGASAGSQGMSSDHRRNTGPMLAGQRCGARTRSGRPCKSPSVRGKRRCRMHGGASVRRPRGNKNALKSGLYTREAIVERKAVRDLLRQSRKLLMLFPTQRER